MQFTTTWCIYILYWWGRGAQSESWCRVSMFCIKKKPCRNRKKTCSWTGKKRSFHWSSLDEAELQAAVSGLLGRRWGWKRYKKSVSSNCQDKQCGWNGKQGCLEVIKPVIFSLESCLEISMDRGASWGTVQGVTRVGQIPTASFDHHACLGKLFGEDSNWYFMEQLEELKATNQLAHSRCSLICIPSKIRICIYNLKSSFRPKLSCAKYFP